ncbi:MAG: polymorphic toxin-type HINT domain-containing protein, partial [Nostoc sp.]
LTPSLEEERTQFVEFTFIRSVTTVVDIQIGETTITCSPEHPFWVPQQGWLKAKELQVGSTLFSLRQGNVTVEHIQIRTGTFTVYNIEVNGLHNYCVSPLGILVHNKAMRWNLQDRAAALRGKVNELIEQASSLPDEAPGKADLLRQAQELEPEASRLSRLAEESGSPEALEPSRSAIENLEERIGNLENQLDIQGIPNEVPGLQAEADALLRRAKSEIPIEVPERWLIIQKIGQLQQDIADLRTLI